MRLARTISISISIFAFAACGDDTTKTTDTTTTDSAGVDGTSAADSAAGEDSATASPDATASVDSATTADAIADASTAADTATFDDTSTAADTATLDDTAVDPDGVCVAGSSAPLPGKLAPVVARIEAKDEAGTVVASDDCVPFEAHADTHLVLARDAADQAYAVFAKTIATDDLTADRSRLAFGSFAPAAGGDVRFTYGPLGASTIAGSVQRFVVDEPSALHHLRPNTGPGFTPVAPSEHGERALVFGLSGLVGSGDADWLEPVEGTMAVRAFQFTVGPQHVFLGCSAAASCEADVVAGTAIDLGTSNSLAEWHRVPAAASVKLWAKAVADGSVTFDGVTVPLGSAGGHHTLIGLMRADGVAVWQDFATAPPAVLGQQVVDVFHANPAANLQFWLEDRSGLVVGRSTFSETRDLAAGQYVVRAYAASVDLAANDPAPLASAFLFAFAGRDALAALAQQPPGAGADTFRLPVTTSFPLGVGEAGAPVTCAATGFAACSFDLVLRGSCEVDVCAP